MMALKQPIKRDVHLDLLRLASMFMIVFLHSIDHSGVIENITKHGGVYSSIYVYFCYALVQICVNCYVLLSGYFLVTSRFKLHKLIFLWIEVVFYALLFKLVFMLFGGTPFSLASLISCFVPILTGRYWFITIYFGMYLISPFLNMAIRAMNKYQHAVLNLVLCLLFSVWSSLHPSIKGMNSGGGWGLAWFVVLYFVGAWLRLYYVPNYKVGRKCFLWLLIPTLMTTVFLGSKALDVPIITRIAKNWFSYNSLPVYLATVVFFLLFLNLRSKNTLSISVFQRFISYISPLTFGVYLIHAHANVSPWLWETSHLALHTQSPYFPLMQFGIVSVIFCGCLLMDAGRSWLFSKLEHSHAVAEKCDGITQWCSKKIRKLIK